MLQEQKIWAKHLGMAHQEDAICCRNKKEGIMRIQLSDHFTYRRLLRFVVSPILMMVCTSFYSIVDGFFVSNYVGKTPFAALNLVFPVCMAFGTVGIMIGTGGSAVVSKTLGEGKREQANQYFSMLVYFSVGLSPATRFRQRTVSW